MMNSPRIAERMFNTPLMVEEGKAGLIAEGFAQRVLGGNVEVNTFVEVAGSDRQMGTVGDKLRQRYSHWGESVLHVQNGVGLIEVEGSLAHKGRYIGQSSGVTTYEGILAQVAEARESPMVRGVVFVI